MSKRNRTARNRGIVIILAVVIIGSLLIWWQPWQSVFPPAVAQPENTATIFQAFFITYQNGETRWYYAPERAVALTVIGIDEVGGIVTKVQTHVFINVNYDASKTLSGWDFSADGRFKIYDRTGDYLMKDFGGAGLRFDFLDDIFGDFLGGKGFSFKKFGRQGGIKFQEWPGGGININEIFGQAQKAQPVRYELAISAEEARTGTKKVLSRKGRRLEVKIPATVKTGNIVKLSNALQLTDGRPGDILIQIRVKDEK